VATPEGCFATDDITVKVFKTGPEIFVPSAFTPNADGKNDILRPIIVGMRRMTFFRVFNRWGQLVYSTSESGKGWDGTLAGKEQASGTYVYSAEAYDFKGNKVSRKGSVVLIR
jgi:gliding motility-associated-like protein